MYVTQSSCRSEQELRHASFSAEECSSAKNVLLGSTVSERHQNKDLRTITMQLLWIKLHKHGNHANAMRGHSPEKVGNFILSKDLGKGAFGKVRSTDLSHRTCIPVLLALADEALLTRSLVYCKTKR